MLTTTAELHAARGRPDAKGEIRAAELRRPGERSAISVVGAVIAGCQYGEDGPRAYAQLCSSIKGRALRCFALASCDAGIGNTTQLVMGLL